MTLLVIALVTEPTVLWPQGREEFESQRVLRSTGAAATDYVTRDVTALYFDTSLGVGFDSHEPFNILKCGFGIVGPVSTKCENETTSRKSSNLEPSRILNEILKLLNVEYRQHTRA